MNAIKFRQRLKGKGLSIDLEQGGDGFHYWGWIVENEGERPTFTAPLGANNALNHGDQFTGLYDKHGKEIYEGDILCNTSWNRGIGKLPLCVVEYNEERAAFTDFGPKSKFEVIGNIYESPELLK